MPYQHRRKRPFTKASGWGVAGQKKQGIAGHGERFAVMRIMGKVPAIPVTCLLCTTQQPSSFFYHLFGMILEYSYLWERIIQGIYLDDGSSAYRLFLIEKGLILFKSNPIFGCGLGQFSSASGTGLYAHNEFIEILATTGLVGLACYYGSYILILKRLLNSNRYLNVKLL